MAIRIMGTAPNLWQELKRTSHATRQPRQRVRVGQNNALGSLSAVVGTETRTSLVTSGALSAMTTPTRELRPLGLICETTNVCNSDCVFCPYSLQTRQFGTMDPDLFSEICRQYVAMGGGPMSLTPVVGDVLLDSKLPSRITMLRRYSDAIQPSVTTNLYALGRHADEVITKLLETFGRLHISVYGITPEENAHITRRKNYLNFVTQARRLSELWERSSRKCSMWVSFRNLYAYAEDTLRRYVGDHFGHAEWLQTGTANGYSNWGGRMSGPLPGDAYWALSSPNHKTCMLLVTAMQVYWDGRVSACSCCDYDAGKDLSLGNVRESTLAEIYNSPTNRTIWEHQEKGQMQPICQNCTFHIPITQLVERRPMGKGWFDFNGG
jgi:radical SAM protein with 4Fe4S-binding SPASM domain